MKILKEDISVALGVVGLLLATYIGSKISKSRTFGGKDAYGNPLPNQNVMNAMKEMWDDKPFLKEFSKILSDEGDFDKIAKQLEDTSNLSTYERWEKIKKPNFKPSGVAKNIVSKLLKTNSYKKLAKKNNFTKEDEKTFSKLLYLQISSRNFTDAAKDFIFNSLEKGWLDDPVIYPRDLYSRPNMM